MGSMSCIRARSMSYGEARSMSCGEARLMSFGRARSMSCVGARSMSFLVPIASQARVGGSKRAWARWLWKFW